ncbi:NAD(+) diphosphatase [Desulfosporosinus hippei]|uniref:NAD-capped RNA hydrolase NudC n=1 Tax=Desulfosporosinus hippei DSM 8344 TaxID=1121419 RepID=A0A1G7VDN5_9FIRM|nr:NAD(+) diphosphatase [Desulfosporosinus hippei]SDG57955.1 NAD+ diphosphatase [Desulfosporosinus hippei DSM 8344]
MLGKVDRDSTAYWLLFKGNKILISEDKVLEFTLPELDFFKLSEKLVRSQFLGQVEGRSYYAAELTPDIAVPENMLFCNLYRLFGKIPDALFFLAGKAYQILHWDRTHQYCSQCGAGTENKIDERAKLCPACGRVNYPRISPAIIVAITRDREILLAKGSRFQADFYSVLAGFVEPGETFEECVQREVREEVGLEVKNIRYFGSQPWPFPDSLMVGFTAEYAGGDIKIDENEILNAGWFDVDQLPQIPGTRSIAWSLIDWFIELAKNE